MTDNVFVQRLETLL